MSDRSVFSLVALHVLAVAALAPALPAQAPPVGPQTPQPYSLDILRDAFDVPHVYAPDDNGAFYGLGYATAEDRLFQMEFGRRVMRGTLSEILDVSAYPNALLLDKRARYLGWAQHAAEVANAIKTADPTTFNYLRSFAAGVNRKLSDLRLIGPWPPMFTTLGLTDMANWSVADCLLSWWRVQQLFDGLISSEPLLEQSNNNVCPPARLVDPGGAVVQHAWSMPLCLEDLQSEEPRYAGWTPTDFLKASHNLVVHGDVTESGLPLMLAKPQLSVVFPNIFYEIDIHGATLHARGVAFPGCPGFLVGWNEHIAWSVTSMGGDMRDVYRLTIPASPPDHYMLDGQSVAMTNVHDEVIHVLGANDVKVKHRRTIWGPVVSEYVDAEGGLQTPLDKGWAYRSVALEDTDQHTVRALIGLMRASDWCEARDAMRLWRGPGAHWLYAGDDGHIGYMAAVVLPVRPANAPCEGNFPLDGSTTASAWLPPIAFDSLPWDLDPAQKFLSTANNLAAAPEQQSNNVVFGPYGDTGRSWRLRELLSRAVTTPPVRAADLQEIDTDAVSPVMRVAGKLTDAAFVQGFNFSPASAPFAQVLANWSCDHPQPGCWELSTTHCEFKTLWKISNAFGRIGQVPAYAELQQTFGDGAAGICKMFKTVEALGVPNFVAAYPTTFSWLDSRLAEAAAFPQQAPDEFTVHYQNNLQVDLFDSVQVSSLPGGHEFKVELDNVFSGTIWSQLGESYVFLADLSNYDANLALLPPGVSEDPTSATHRSHVALWQAGLRYAAPISRPAVEALGTFSVTTLAYP